MRSTISTDVAATPELVFGLARDVERWPQLLPHYDRVRVVARGADGTLTAVMVARRPLVPAIGLGLPVAWRSRVTVEPVGLRLRFRHLGGATGGMEVLWRIESTSGGCRVSIEHDFRRRVAIPLLGSLLGEDAWPALIDRFFTRPIAGQTLASFRALAETLAATLADVPESDPPLDANQDV
jgi:ribosome-associated toxin RatA of RatAB toxin-antitoxin module